MNKKQIIESVANASVAEGALLIEREHAFGVRVARVGNSPGGMSIAMAKIFHAHLTEDTADLGETPDAQLLNTLHRSSIRYHGEILEVLTIVEPAKDVVEEHKKVVGLLREISAKLGITYREPDDPFTGE